MNLISIEAQNITIKPCPICRKIMTIKKTLGVIEGGYKKWFYFLYCSQCGYGPHHAFDSIFQAIGHWNDAALNTMPPVEFYENRTAWQ